MDLQKENDKLKKGKPTQKVNLRDKEEINKLKEDNVKLVDEYNDLEKENEKLKKELKKVKDLQKIVDALRMNKKDLAKNYKTESISLDYLRPTDFEEDKYENDNSYRRSKRPVKVYDNKMDSYNQNDDRNKSEKAAALALMRIRQAQEQRRQNDN